jgi:protein associated with RNAse G/E
VHKKWEEHVCIYIGEMNVPCVASSCLAQEAKHVLLCTTVGCVLATEAWLNIHVMFNREGIFDAQHV